MFKQLLRSNHASKRRRDATVILNSTRNESTKDLKRILAEAFGYVQRRTRMDIEEKMKELAELFAKTGKELGEMVKKNEEFIMAEIQRAETAIRETSEVCSRKHMGRLQDVKEAYADRMKECNDKAAYGLRAAKTKCDEQIQGAEHLRNSMKQILKECLDADEFAKCVASRTKETAERRKRIVEALNETVKNAEISVAEQLMEASKCHANAQAESLKNLHQILKDLKDCLVENI